ncbi:MAG: hypothetical protein AAGA56_13275 [Myxococcota bacterium]
MKLDRLLDEIHREAMVAGNWGVDLEGLEAGRILLEFRGEARGEAAMAALIPPRLRACPHEP